MVTEHTTQRGRQSKTVWFRAERGGVTERKQRRSIKANLDGVECQYELPMRPPAGLSFWLQPHLHQNTPHLTCSRDVTPGMKGNERI